MFVVGLTGGVGSGKSTVAELLAHHGVLLIDADEVAREVVAPETLGLQAILARFGRELQRPDGSLDRAGLAGIVFGDEDALADLNSIVHPLVREVIEQRLDALRDGDDTVLLVVPLLVESGNYKYDRLIVVDCDEEVAVRRLVDGRGWTEKDARRRIAAQATREERRHAADLIIDNSGPRDRLTAQIERAWHWIRDQRTP